jgi:hypothetical protein
MRTGSSVVGFELAIDPVCLPRYCPAALVGKARRNRCRRAGETGNRQLQGSSDGQEFEICPARALPHRLGARGLPVVKPLPDDPIHQ